MDDDNKKPEGGEKKEGDQSSSGLDLNLGENKPAEGTEEKSWQEKLGLEKFKTVEDLGKSYKELEKKFSSQDNRKLSELSDEELIARNKETFKELEGIKSGLDGEYGSLSESVSEELGLPTKLTDSIVGKASKHLASATVLERKKEASEFLKDAAKKESVVNGIKAVGGDYEKSFQKRLEGGQVAIEELTVLSTSGSSISEADLGLKGQQMSEVDAKEAEKEYLELSKGDKYLAVTDPKHPEHLALKSRKAQLERILGIS